MFVDVQAEIVVFVDVQAEIVVFVDVQVEIVVFVDVQADQGLYCLPRYSIVLYDSVSQ